MFLRKRKDLHFLQVRFWRHVTPQERATSPRQPHHSITKLELMDSSSERTISTSVHFKNTSVLEMTKELQNGIIGHKRPFTHATPAIFTYLILRYMPKFGETTLQVDLLFFVISCFFFNDLRG